MSANEHSKYVKSGVRIRAEGKQFVIARENCTTDTATKFTWGPTNEDIAGLKNYADTNVGVYEDFDYRANTDAIIAQGTAQGTTHPAAEAANSYTTCKKSTEGVDDPWSWGLPTVPMVMMFYRYRTQLNSFLNTYFGSSYQLTSDWHWTSNEWSSASAWYVYVSYGASATAIRVTPSMFVPFRQYDSIISLPLYLFTSFLSCSAAAGGRRKFFLRQRNRLLK
jgi:hypothetical protein